MRVRVLIGLLLGVAAPAAMAAESVVGNAFFHNSPAQQMVLVEKDAYSAYLVEAENDRPRVVKRFDQVLMGANGGDKLVEGDKRTPEGVYYIQRYIPSTSLAAMYGAGAFPLNYPNIVDRIEDKTGYGIWLHGVDEDDEDKRATKGCVAFDNSNLEVLKEALDIGTPVVITKDAEFLSPARYQERRADLFARLKGFLSAWENNDFAALKSYVHPDFRNAQGEDAEAYLAQKKRLMDLYPQRQVDADHIQVYKENGHRVVYDFDQFYCAANVAAYGRKRLYFKQGESGRPRLMAAEYFPRAAAPEILRRVKDFLAGWRRSWENRDLGSYLDHYAADFTHNGADLEQWRTYKKGVFQRRSNIQVGMEHLWVRRIRPNRYVVGFDQRFRSDDYNDYGVKTLVLSGCPGAFEISAEYWRPLP
ncbi:L,D-transpeptidase family protein [Thiohalorhabdus methylotrophus]|uniref:L,D-transpeptidase family protein n=1 Tax=Thiohalorhabdus methylotrophus TaxID=3242694 RepID=A0ABV4U0T7_9GAMM